jgi:hypothetical protein
VSCVVCRVSCVVCRVSCVVCRVSCVVCRVSCAVCHCELLRFRSAEVLLFTLSATCALTSRRPDLPKFVNAGIVPNLVEVRRCCCC